ncbi:glycerophosphodiester phosphodiesterase family protein [Roseibium sp. CAU 1637]|uniref:Glycerophosphodiester phosphodiesterase family protein n=1 Tax=Roseibium limicola TaxID=2816037 RepID=A0A939ENM8_9HYPH|nr:glycerophosphodiester phosphodiesterase family protein [Roseibium limicola]
MKKARIICHRGDSIRAPENTFASLEGAVALGAEVVEFDIHTSRDGVLYVIHDEAVDRTTNGTGLVAEMTSSELDALDAGSWFAPEFAGQRIPRLDAFLDACVGRIVPYAEIKAADPGDVRDMLARRGLLRDAWTFSFDPAIRAETRARVPDFRRSVLYKHVGSVARAVELEAAILEFHPENLTEAVAAEARAVGLVTQIFYAGNDPVVFEAAVRSGIEQMNIDEVDLFRQVEQQINSVSG